MSEPVNRSAPTGPRRLMVAGWSVVAGAPQISSLSVHDLSYLGSAVLKGDEARLAEASGCRPGATVAFSVSAMVAAYVSGERVVVAETAEETVDVAGTLQRRAGGELFGLSGARTTLRVAGDPAERLVSRLSEMLLDRARFGNGAAARGLLGNVTVSVNRLDRGADLSYLLVVRRSVGRYLADLVLEAGDDLGVGWGSPEIGLGGLSEVVSA